MSTGSTPRWKKGDWVMVRSPPPNIIELRKIRSVVPAGTNGSKHTLYWFDRSVGFPWSVTEEELVWDQTAWIEQRKRLR